VDASYLEKTIQVGEKRVKMVIWDTAGQEKYHALAKNYYQGASGALLVYDVTDEDSFQRATTWHKELIHEIGREAPIILAGNKCDIMNHTV
jgi:small GTP-binding protein